VRAQVVSLVLVVACVSARRPLPPPGAWTTAADTPYASAADEGAGELAQQSVRLSFGGDGPAPPERRRAPVDGDTARYGGASYGGASYGGDSYGAWVPPQIPYTTPTRPAPYTPRTGLGGAVEGVVTWVGPVPARVATACGTIDNPTLRLGEGKALRGALVYVDKVSIGRPGAYYGKPAVVGGIVVKRGCVLAPAAQVVAPVAAPIAIHGDGKRVRLRIAQRSYELQEGGLVKLDAPAGVTRVEADDGSLSPAWLVAIDSPYYAITDDAGRFRIDELAPGTYDVTIMQPAATTALADGTLATGPPIVIHRSVRVDRGRPTRLDVVVR
jgi:hypothetical protein